jgi:transposase-like protein
LLFPGKKNAAVYFFYRLKTGKIHHSNLIAKTRRTRRGEREKKKLTTTKKVTGKTNFYTVVVTHSRLKVAMFSILSM